MGISIFTRNNNKIMVWKKIFNLRILILTTIVFLNAVSCTNMSSSNGASNKIYFRPEIGSVFEFELNEQQEVGQSDRITNGEWKTFLANNITFSYKLENKGPGNRFRVSVRFMGYKRRYKVLGKDSIEDSRIGHFQGGLKAFNDAVFVVDIEPSGKVSIFSGNEDFESKFGRSDDKNPLEKNRKDLIFFPKEYFAELIGKISTILPDTGVSVGDSWTRKQSPNLNEPVNTIITYRITEIKGGIAYIKTSSATEKELMPQSTIGQNTTMLMKGLGEGNILLDANTGMLIESENSINITGTNVISGINVKINTNYKTDIKGKRV